MNNYDDVLIAKVRIMRAGGSTYREICNKINVDIPKSTLTYWCKNTRLPRSYQLKIRRLNVAHLKNARTKAVVANKSRRLDVYDEIKNINSHISLHIRELPTAKIALAMLCLGEATKYPNPFCFGNANPKIIQLFLKLLEKSYNFDERKVRCTVQCRADQNTLKLEHYWANITNIPSTQFYRTRIDKRTIGKPTVKDNYFGVLRINYLDTRVQLELESLAELLYGVSIEGL